jgi:hypothetical protein
VTSARNLASAHGADKDIALPVWETIASIDDHSRDGDGWYPHHDRRFHAFPRRVLRNARPRVITAKANYGPAVIAAGENDVDLIAAVGAVFVIPQSARFGMDHQAEGIAVAKRVDVWPVAGTIREGIIGRRRAVVTQAENLAPEAARFLRDGSDVAAGGHIEHSIAAKRDARAEASGARIGVGDQYVAHVGEAAAFEPPPRERGCALIVFHRLV